MPHAFLRTVRDESGLLTGWGPDHYGFMHLGFQEYLAACELRRLAFEGDKDAVLKDLASHYGESWWQEVILMLLAQGNPSLFTPFMRQALCHPRFGEATELLGLILEEAAEVSVAPFVELLQQPPGEDPGHWARQLKALHVLERLGADAELDTLVKSLRQHPLGEVQALAQARAQAAIRPTRVTQQGGVELVLIPGGTFRMGSPASDAEGYRDERPEHDVQVPTFYLGRHPVTNEEYGRFLKANPDVEEPKLLGRPPIQPSAATGGGRVLGGRATVRAVGRGTAYPPKPNGNTPRGRGRRRATGGVMRSGRTMPTVPGVVANGTVSRRPRWVPSSRTPLACTICSGMCGNGSRTAGMRATKVRPRMVRPGPRLDDCAQRVIRGGSWDSEPRDVRSANRDRNTPDDRNYDVGFRLAQDI